MINRPTKSFSGSPSTSVTKEDKWDNMSLHCRCTAVGVALNVSLYNIKVQITFSGPLRALSSIFSR